MQSPREHWIHWAVFLRRYQLDGIVTWLLEAGRPLAFVSAQILYFGRPFLGQEVDSLAQMLESGDESHAFAAFLEGEAAL